MNQNTVVGIVMGLVVVVGGGYYLMSTNPIQAPRGTSPQIAETAQAGKFTGSVAELTKRGGSWKCTVDAATAQSISAGVTYVSGNKVRADFTTLVQGYGSVESHMIADGESVYSWSSMMPQGIKTTMMAQGVGGTATSGQGGDANQSYSYDCQPWTSDASLLVPPANVTFKTVGQ
jgi:hypothetical protein